METTGPQKDDAAEHGDPSQFPSGEEAKFPPMPNIELPTEPKFEPELNPTYEMYLEKTTEIPEHLNEAKFLSKNLLEHVVVASYPRSGNSMIRKYLEDITATFTGSDFDPRIPMAENLLNHGMQGEFQYDDKLWMVKTHHPIPLPHKQFDGNKVVLLVRNPLDAFVSTFNFMVTKTFNSSITDDTFENCREHFDDFLSKDIPTWRDYHLYWMDEPTLPTYIVRFEDLLAEPKNTLMDLFRFLLNENDLEGTLIEALIDRHVENKNKKQVYKPRKGKANCNQHLFNDAEIKKIKQETGQVLKRLGYVKEDAESSNTTGYYSDDEDIESSSQYEWDKFTRNGQEVTVSTRYGYKELNKMTLDKVCTEEYRNSVKELSSLESMKVNLKEDFLHGPYPGGKGPFFYFRNVAKTVDILLPDGTIKKAEES